MVLRWLKVLAPMLGLAVIAYLLANTLIVQGRGAATKEESAVPRRGGSLPAFTLQTLEGGTVTRDDLLGKPVWLNFWASWCGPCRAEMPDLAAVYQEQRDRVNLLTINEGEAKDVARSFLAEAGYDLPVALDDGALFSRWGFRFLPTHVFADRRGRICEIFEGALSREDMLQKLARARRGC